MGVTSFAEMQTHLSVATVCGSCTCEVKQIIEDKLQQELGSRRPHSFATEKHIAY